ncbi:MAG: glycosyltransferase family 4 protein [Rhodospirillales bacterium]
MHIAFYAPMKPPDDPRPSGDREVARHLLAALAMGTGREVRLASRLSSYDGTGDGRCQERLARAGRRRARTLITQLRARPTAERPALWFTYHLYHKAPDWLGPPVAHALGIPYVVAEASHAKKQANGPWAPGYRASCAAIAAANLHFVLNPGDAGGLRQLIDEPTRLTPLPAFIDTDAFARVRRDRAAHRARAAQRLGLDPAATWLITVAVMRCGGKLRSYRLLAEALALMEAENGERDWRLIIVGDGPARPAVEDAFRPLPPRRIVWLGEVERRRLPPLLAAADVFLWPAIDEPIGIAALEAQAAGLPVVGGRRPGLATIVADGVTGLLPIGGDAGAFAAAVERLLDDPVLRRTMGLAAAARAGARHGLAQGAAALARGLAPLFPCGEKRP